MNTTQLILSILSGGMLGIIGQGIRLAVGLKKLSDANTVNIANRKPQEEMTTSRILTSIFIGFVAGALAMIVKDASSDLDQKIFSSEAIVTVIAIGYSGADFIEGVFNTYISKKIPADDPTSANNAASRTMGQDLEDEFVG